MDLRFECLTVLLGLLLLFTDVAEAIKCKCTKESETVTCVDGACEMEGGSCLMLDHPSLGVHYTCHTRSLQDRSCRTKTSNSGAAVNICGCEAEDFCNEKLWPNGFSPAPAVKTTTESVNGAPSSIVLGSTVALGATAILLLRAH